MTRILAALLFCLWTPFGATAQNQPAAPSPAVLSPAQARQALDVLKDDGKRAQVISVLEALAAMPASRVAASPAAPPAPVAAGTPAPTLPAGPSTQAAAEKTPLPLAPDSLGAQLLVGISGWVSIMSERLVVTLRTITDFPLIWRWLETLSSDPYVRGQLAAAGWKLVLVMAVGLLAEWVAARVLRRPAEAIARLVPRWPEHQSEPPSAAGIAEAEAGQTEALHFERLTRRLPAAWLFLRRLPFVLLHFAVDLLPVLAVLAAGTATLGVGVAALQITIEPVTRLVILAALNAYVLFRGVLSVTRMLVAPADARLRLMPVSDPTAAYVMQWVQRIVAVGIFGYTIIETGLLFGLYRLAHDALLKLVGLALHAFVLIIILQQRSAVAAVIQPRPGATGIAARIRALLAPIWHVPAIFYVVALWVVAALDVPNGFTRLLQAFLVTAAIMAVGRYVLVLSLGLLGRTVRQGNASAGETPGVGARLRAYQPVVRMIVKLVVFALTFLALLEAWGVSVLAWFVGSSLGGRLVASLSTLGITILMALLVWEWANAGVEGHLARLTAEAQAAKSARLRTLLPMLRTALLVAILVVVGLVILSEVGLNIGPLLAGAGVVGLAIGFGSQKLVQDIITGLFLLLENTMQVGDVVTLGGLTGTVENLSVRTIRLRAIDGAVHIVPFSAVTTVTNMTRDFGYAVLDISVGLNEEPDHITTLMTEIAASMRAEPRWASAIGADLDVMGLEKFLPDAWVLRVRLRTTPGQRWAVGRELNRRIKNRFDALAIESPMTSTRVLSTNPPPPAVAVAPA